MSGRRKPDLKVDVAEKPQKEEKKPFSLTNTGTFIEGDLAINKKGLLIKGESPKSNPSPSKSRESESTTVGSSTHLSYPSHIESLDLKSLKLIKILGRGSSGTVHQALHIPTNKELALKVITLEAEESIRKNIIGELKTLHKTQSEYIVSFFDAFYEDGTIYIAMEYMDKGSIADLLKSAGTLPEVVLAKITTQVLNGLIYLHKQLHLIHRDVKPSNFLVSSTGKVKISDFGVSSQLAHTISKAVSWVGTVTYMSPERIKGQSYSFDSDIWGLGLSLVECALGRFPYPPIEGPASTPPPALSFFELMGYIVRSPPPTLPAEKFSPEFCDFVSKCLQKSPELRPTAQSLLTHPFILKYNSEDFDMGEWVKSLS
eukprot:TRINITY_DN12262_c0_g2_i1.p1 TRINITY_DN12262_c0_g2~~TRINITY_DN12262_c0_g2_i1.p1  ORF type:complete len:372 (-),score=82.23 TRINITY_DN12262_c0_g2_i1:93-1208(-)